MSFFDELINDMKLENSTDDISCLVNFGKNAIIISAYKIVQVDDTLVTLKIKKHLLKIVGSELTIKTMSKGELCVQGNVTGVFYE